MIWGARLKRTWGHQNRAEVSTGELEPREAGRSYQGRAGATKSEQEPQGASWSHEKGAGARHQGKPRQAPLLQRGGGAGMTKNPPYSALPINLPFFAVF